MQEQKEPQNIFSRSTPDLIAAEANPNANQRGIPLRTTFNDSFDGGNSRFGGMSEKQLNFKSKAAAKYEEEEADLQALVTRPQQTYLTLKPRKQEQEESFYLPRHYYQPAYQPLHQYEHTYYPEDEEIRVGNEDCPDCVQLHM